MKLLIYYFIVIIVRMDHWKNVYNYMLCQLSPPDIEPVMTLIYCSPSEYCWSPKWGKALVRSVQRFPKAEKKIVKSNPA